MDKHFRVQASTEHGEKKQMSRVPCLGPEIHKGFSASQTQPEKTLSGGKAMTQASGLEKSRSVYLLPSSSAINQLLRGSSEQRCLLARLLHLNISGPANGR